MSDRNVARSMTLYSDLLLVTVQLCKNSTDLIVPNYVVFTVKTKHIVVTS